MNDLATIYTATIELPRGAIPTRLHELLAATTITLHPDPFLLTVLGRSVPYVSTTQRNPSHIRSKSKDG